MLSENLLRNEIGNRRFPITFPLERLAPSASLCDLRYSRSLKDKNPENTVACLFPSRYCGCIGSNLFVAFPQHGAVCQPWHFVSGCNSNPAVSIFSGKKADRYKHNKQENKDRSPDSGNRKLCCIVCCFLLSGLCTKNLKIFWHAEKLRFSCIMPCLQYRWLICLWILRLW